MHAKPTSHLDGLLTQTPEEEGGLPSPNGRDYRPHSRPANKSVYALHLISPAWEVRTFQYADLDSDSRYAAGVIRLRFTGTTPVDVTLRGRNLWRLYDGIHRQVITWVMEAGRDFGGDGECVVSRLDVTPVAGRLVPNTGGGDREPHAVPGFEVID